VARDAASRRTHHARHGGGLPTEAEGTKDPGLRRQLAEMAIYCEKMADAIEKLKAKEKEVRARRISALPAKIPTRREMF